MPGEEVEKEMRGGDEGRRGGKEEMRGRGGFLWASSQPSWAICGRERENKEEEGRKGKGGSYFKRNISDRRPHRVRHLHSSGTTQL